MSYVASASLTRRFWRLEKPVQTIRPSANQATSVLAGNRLALVNVGPQDDQGLPAGITDRVDHFRWTPDAASMYRVAGSCTFTAAFRTVV